MARVRVFRVGKTEASQQNKRVLNTGSGPKSSRGLHSLFDKSSWEESRVDVDASVEPDIVGSITDMSSFADDSSYDAVWCSHNLEHLYEHEVVPALREFRRILKDTGFAFITCPDIEQVAAFLVENGPRAVVYTAPAGPIRAIDMMFGHSRSIAAGHVSMAHHTGFTASTLGESLLEAGFTECRVQRGKDYDLWAIALMPQTDLVALQGALQNTAQAGLIVS